MESTHENRLRVAEIQLSYKTNLKPSERPQITSSRECYNLLLSTWEESRLEFVEEFKVLLLNRAHRVLGLVEISRGCNTGTVVDPKLVFVAAIKANACSVIITHNHPSGNVQPSQADRDLTRKLRDGGKLLEVTVLDHIVLSKEGYFSFADEGLL